MCHQVPVLYYDNPAGQAAARRACATRSDNGVQEIKEVEAHVLRHKAWELMLVGRFGAVKLVVNPLGWGGGKTSRTRVRRSEKWFSIEIFSRQGWLVGVLMRGMQVWARTHLRREYWYQGVWQLLE